jgi:hypothetical protein
MRLGVVLTSRPAAAADVDSTDSFIPDEKRKFRMRRRELLKFLLTQPVLADCATFLGRPHDRLSSKPSGAVLRNQHFELACDFSDGLQCRLTHLETSSILADGDYFYSFGRPVFSKVEQDSSSLVLEVATESGLIVHHRFSINSSVPCLEEEIKLTNRSSQPRDLHDLRAAFVLPIQSTDAETPGSLSRSKFTAIPFRREPAGHRTQYGDFTLEHILTEQFSSELWPGDTTVTAGYASEGWAWTRKTHGFLISKYSPNSLEFSILDRMTLRDDQLALRWGGAGVYRGTPEHGAWLLPGESHQFGITRITAFRGDWLRAFYVFRSEMEERGHGCPSGFSPPVHWNEIYDNKLWWLPGEGEDDPAMRKKYYTLKDMKGEAQKAKDIGAEALYLDPGWDTNFGSKVWDSERLGSYQSFTETLSREFGLKSSLHTPLSGWCNPNSYPIETYRLDRFGQRAVWDASLGISDSVICGASEQYLRETTKRLKILAREGAAFFMFDGTAYREECWDADHGHPIPARLEEHCKAMCRLARMVHAEYPDVLIEMHDPANGGSPNRTCPIYYGHGSCQADESNCAAKGFDSVWAFELMWKPMEDLLSGRSVALYYYNLAYSLPLYIHVDLRTDNENAIVFWWNASTCRHLGIGGTPTNPAIREIHRQSMATYLRLKAHFSDGLFFGIDEETHVHCHRDGMSAVINCFNLEDRPVTRKIRFDPAEFGLSPAQTWRFSGAPFQKPGSAYLGEVKIAARGHTLVEIDRTEIGAGPRDIKQVELARRNGD